MCSPTPYATVASAVAPPELESLIETSVTRVYDVDFERLHTLLEEEARGIFVVYRRLLDGYERKTRNNFV